MPGESAHARASAHDVFFLRGSDGLFQANRLNSFQLQPSKVQKHGPALHPPEFEHG
jgi:hypothetical protein